MKIFYQDLLYIEVLHLLDKKSPINELFFNHF